MIVPKFWAEARTQHREKGKQVTVRRFGWSQSSLEEAQANAEARAADALRKLLAGAKLDRREPKVAYNGAEGVPIREEIVAEHGDTVITRNSYGALCLNTPDVLFADVDFQERLPEGTGCSVFFASFLLAVGLGMAYLSLWLFIGILILGGLCSVVVSPLTFKLKSLFRGGSERIAKTNLSSFMAAHPDWKLRLYRTPAGLRIMAMHRLFTATEPEVEGFFKALKSDPIYVTMCQRQQCFRARVSPKPWRIGIGDHLRPRRGVWPVHKEALPSRHAWIETYQAKAAKFAACRFEAELGQGATHEKARAVQQLHDQLCRADSGLPIA